MEKIYCEDCDNTWEGYFDTDGENKCPDCDSHSVMRREEKED